VTNIYKGFPGTHALAYFDTDSVMKKKVLKTVGGNVVKHILFKAQKVCI
jgi:hypothetical protein